jgi:hypothetical protein
VKKDLEEQPRGVINITNKKDCEKILIKRLIKI